MSDNRSGGGGEPSMEEILASIRKIISEDTNDSGQRGAADTAAADAGTPAGKEPDADGDVLELSEETSGPPASDADDEPLDLTEEVEAPAAQADDGPLDLDEPVELDDPVDPQAADAGSHWQDAPGPAGADDWTHAPGGGFADIAGDDAGGADSAVDAPVPDQAQDQPAAAAAPEEIEAETPFLADPFDDSGAGSGAPDPAVEAALAAGGMAGAGAATAGDEARDRGRAADDGTTGQGTAGAQAGHANQVDRVVSQEAEDAAVDQLTSLARAAQNQPGNATDNVDHILARMVRDALRPQLREWMDRNLPQIVERIVREEVQRMTKRAQGLDDDGRY